MGFAVKRVLRRVLTRGSKKRGGSRRPPPPQRVRSLRHAPCSVFFLDFLTYNANDKDFSRLGLGSQRAPKSTETQKGLK